MKEDPKVRPWKTLSSKIAFDEPWMRIRQDKVQLPSGRIVGDYFLWESPTIAHAAAMTPEGKLVLVRQWRHAAGRVMLVNAAGSVDHGESAEEAARRELEEETGYVSAEPFVHLGSFTTYETKLTGTHEVFFTTGAKPTGRKAADDQEESELVLMTPKELVDSLSDSTLHGGSLLAVTLMVLRHLKFDFR